MTVFFRNSEITIYRMRPRNNDRAAFSATFTVYNADIQPAGISRTQDGSLRIGKQWEAFVDVDVAINEGDQVVTQDGKRYSVRGVSIYRGAGLLDHRHLLLESVSA